MIQKQVITCCALLWVIFNAQASPGGKQKERQDIVFGIRTGAVYTGVTNLSNVLVSESYYSGYSFSNKKVWSPTGGLFINYRFPETISAIETEMSYMRLNNVLHYSDINSFEYDMKLKYDLLNIQLMYKLYPFYGLTLSAGPRIGFNLTPEALYYTSNGEDTYGPDIRIQQQMRDVLKGRANFSVGIGLGYELDNGLSLDVRYYFGISDVLETQVNNYKFIENSNHSQALQLTLGFIIPYSGVSKRRP
jgi:hypothetical protein